MHFHEGELRMQARAGEREIASRIGEQLVRQHVPDVAAVFLGQQRLLFVGHRDDDGAVWASVLSGSPGFITTPDSRTVLAAASPAAGDRLTTSLADGPRPLGMLAIELGTRRRMRMNGIGRMRDGALELITDQVYSNCPKYISTRQPGDGPARADGSAEARHFDGLDSSHRELIRSADTFFVASAHSHDGADVSHRGGNPGFVDVVDGNHLGWPDYRGNSLYNTLGNLDVDPHAGLLFPDWSTGNVLQLTGTAVSDWSGERVAGIPGALRMVDFVIDEVVEIPGGLGGRWSLETLARANPPAATPFESRAQDQSASSSVVGDREAQ